MMWLIAFRTVVKALRKTVSAKINSPSWVPAKLKSSESLPQVREDLGDRSALLRTHSLRDSFKEFEEKLKN